MRTGYRSPWQNGICERCIGLLRWELLDHIIPMSERHLMRLLSEYVTNYYNPERTHQGIGKQTPIPKEQSPVVPTAETSLSSQPILGGLYHIYHRKAA
ncbi:MAG: integrase core domain-containing protein [bacterium]|nr:integrase core domain-containing protein [bacterium]